MNVQALGWSLLHFVWQGTAAAALLASLELLLRRAAPQVRYLCASATLFLMLLLPLATFRAVRWVGTPAVADALAPGSALGRVGDAEGAAGLTASPGDASRPLSRSLRSRLEPLLPATVVVWGVGVLLLSLRSFGGWALAQRLKRAGLSRPLPRIDAALARLVRALRVSAPVRLYESALVQVPTVVGWLRPVILLPASAVTGLSAQQLELILAHELAHIRRYDYLVNLLQTAVETLLFYHPAVWWVSHRMRVEREHCCDDLAVAACGNAARYARALADLEGLRTGLPALAMVASGGSLLGRVTRLVGQPQHLSRSSRGLAALLAVVSLSAALGAGSFLLAHSAPAPPGSSAQEPAPPAESAPAAEPAPAAETPAAASPRPAARPRRSTAPAASPTAEPRAFPLNRIIELARAGVTPEYIDELAALGYPSLTADQLMGLRTQGVGPDYVRALAEEGYRSLTPDQLVSLRSQGVSADYIHGMKEQGLTDLSLSDIIELRSQGVGPEFVADMKRAGYDASVSRLIALRGQGVSGQYVAELKSLGYDKLSFSRLIALRSMGITPDYVRGLASLGYKALGVPMLIALRNQGVTPDYVAGLKQAGYADLPAGTLIELRSHGVTPEYVRELKEAGFEKLRPEELIEMRDNGVRAELLKRLRGRQ